MYKLTHHITSLPTSQYIQKYRNPENLFLSVSNANAITVAGPVLLSEKKSNPMPHLFQKKHEYL